MQRFQTGGDTAAGGITDLAPTDLAPADSTAADSTAADSTGAVVASAPCAGIPLRHEIRPETASAAAPIGTVPDIAL
ncbi:hypothetical protein [Actinomadura livida]|uniref:Uncharacterized protein n=1 Tax=Actinomadura livida TaxID=79909 RepID=A0A7W7MZY2_9ACTN|nr:MULTISPECIES: hypothetical protein [Actinomadura]MBB4776554.1 hypothetical protein [Actinomadura catellatispora]